MAVVACLLPIFPDSATAQSQGTSRCLHQSLISELRSAVCQMLCRCASAYLQPHCKILTAISTSRNQGTVKRPELSSWQSGMGCVTAAAAAE